MKRIWILKVPMILLLIISLSGLAHAGDDQRSWVLVSLGVNGLAMDDINNTDFRWHEDSPDGFGLGEVTAGMALSFGIGYDLSPAISYGLIWEHQYATTKGTDQDLTADVNLAADNFLGRMEYRFLRKEKWRLGLAGSLGYMVVGGEINKTTSGASYGDSDLSGNTWAFEGMAIVDIVVGKSSTLQISGGWREAKVKSFKNASAPVLKDDGSDMSLDYSGFTARVGLKYSFGSSEYQTTPDIK